MKKLLIFFIQTVALSFAIHAYGDGVIIVNPGNASKIGPTAVKQIFLGKSKAFPDGNKSYPINLSDSDKLRIKFDNDMLGKNPKQMKAYWSRLIFSGKAVPIDAVKSDSEVIEHVANNPGGIGYVKAESVNDKVKVIHKF